MNALSRVFFCKHCGSFDREHSDQFHNFLTNEFWVC